MPARFFFSFMLVIITGLLAGQTLAAPGDDAGQFPWEGEISGMNVYVRSGPGVNYYPATKLSAGDRVLVLGDKFGWRQVVPPPGSFSFIDMAMVQRRPGENTGTVNRNGVYVRAGSLLSQRKTSTQLVLKKGATVEILGETDGFYKIVPPRGASLYVSKGYVQFVPPRMRTGLAERYLGVDGPRSPSAAKTRRPAGVDPSRARATPADGDDDLPLALDSTLPAESAESGTSTPAVDTQNAGTPSMEPAAESKRGSTGRYQVLLTLIESDMKTMMREPVVEQDISSLLDRYHEIVDQTEERVPAEIAKVRLRQLGGLIELRRNRLKLQADAEDLEEFRRRMSAERMKIARRRIEATMEKYDLEGELRRSLAFAPEKRRYRLVDPQTHETIAYVDVPRTVKAHVERMIGSLVGIRTVSQEFNPSVRVPFAVAGSITDLSPRNAIPPAVPPVLKPDESSNAGNNDGVVAKSSPAATGEGGPKAETPRPGARAEKRSEPDQ